MHKHRALPEYIGLFSEFTGLFLEYTGLFSVDTQGDAATMYRALYTLEKPLCLLMIGIDCSSKFAVYKTHSTYKI